MDNRSRASQAGRSQTSQRELENDEDPYFFSKILVFDIIFVAATLNLFWIGILVGWPSDFFYTHRPNSIKPLQGISRSLIRSSFIYHLSNVNEGYGDVPTELIFPKNHPPEGLRSITVDTENEVVYVAGKNNVIYSVDKTTDRMKFVAKLCDVGECDPSSIVFFNGTLYLSSLDLGIVSYNPKEQSMKIISYPQQLEGEKEDLKVPLVKEMSIAPNGKIYWTDYSLAHNYYSDANYFEAFFMDPFGRLVEYDPVRKKHRVLLCNLAMPGGVQVSEDGSYVLVTETLAARIRIYYLSGLWKGRSEIYMEGLPGLPYGIQRDTEDSYIVSLFTVIAKDRKEPWLPHVWAEHYVKRRTMFRAMYYSRIVCNMLFKPLGKLFCLAHKVLYDFYANPIHNEGSLVVKVKNTRSFYGFDVGKIVEKERFHVNREAGGVMDFVRHGSYFYTTAFGGKTFIRHNAKDNSSLIVSKYRVPREITNQRITRIEHQLTRVKAKIDKHKRFHPIYLDPWMYEDDDKEKYYTNVFVDLT